MNDGNWLLPNTRARSGPEVEDDPIKMPADGTSLDLLQAVYRNPGLDLHVRMRAAMAALPHEVPKLMATAIMNEGSFAELLDRRLKRIEETKLIEAAPSNGKNADANTDANGKTDATLAPRIPDRRWRRA